MGATRCGQRKKQFPVSDINVAGECQCSSEHKQGIWEYLCLTVLRLSHFYISPISLLNVKVKKQYLVDVIAVISTSMRS